MENVRTKPERVPAARKIARHRVRKSIEQMIVDGRFRPGEKLVQLQLSRQFGVSLGMVREALFELEGLGLVESFDNRGVRVRLLDAQALHELSVLRELFDGLAARECCGKLQEKDAVPLRQTAERIYLLSQAGEYEERILLDREFHLRIAELSGNRLLMALARQHHLLGKIVGTTMDARVTLDGHLAIIDAILAGDADLAERAAREHLRRSPATESGAASTGLPGPPLRQWFRN
jgi:DNA-binding GntR family transcriptional regulator